MAQDPAEALLEPERLAVLTLDGRKWLLPQREIQSLEPLLDVVADDGSPDRMGVIAFQENWWPVYCVSGELDVLREIPAARRVCVLLNDGDNQFALVCDQVEALDEERPRIRPLPACMALPDSPLQALLVYKGGLGCITTTVRLAAFFARREGLESAYA